MSLLTDTLQDAIDGGATPTEFEQLNTHALVEAFFLLDGESQVELCESIKAKRKEQMELPA